VKRPNANPTTWYKKNMLSENLMFDVDENANENDSLSGDPTTLDELDEDEVKHDPFEFPHDDEIPFSRFLFDLMVWQVQRFDIGDVNMNMELLDNNVQVSNAPPQAIHAQMAPNQNTSMQSMGSMEVDPPINANTPLAQIIISKSNAQ
jgi:hypothetical protein